jgi:hypothetical protein
VLLLLLCVLVCGVAAGVRRCGWCAAATAAAAAIALGGGGGGGRCGMLRWCDGVLLLLLCVLQLVCGGSGGGRSDRCGRRRPV